LADWVHRPVMVGAVLEYLAPKPGQVILDATCGPGGHAVELGRRVRPDGLVIGVDRDRAALEVADVRLKETDVPYRLFQADYRDLDEVLKQAGIDRLDGLLFDLGISSEQLARPDRGFSFVSEGPLDMRFDPTCGEPTAADLLARLSERELADVFFRYGEERNSRRIAAAMVRTRREHPIRTTSELAEIVAACRRGPRERIHPATRVFQALRIAVNHELEAVEGAVKRSPDWLKRNGRVVFIAFHSLEDRIVKEGIRAHVEAGLLEGLTKKVVRPSEEEVSENPRARSARLRAAMRR